MPLAHARLFDEGITDRRRGGPWPRALSEIDGWISATLPPWVMGIRSFFYPLLSTCVRVIKERTAQMRRILLRPSMCMRRRFARVLLVPSSNGRRGNAP